MLSQCIYMVPRSHIHSLALSIKPYSEVIAIVWIKLIVVIEGAAALHSLMVVLHVHLALADDVSVLVFVREAGPLACVLQALYVLGRQLHLRELLREVLRAVLIV